MRARTAKYWLPPQLGEDWTFDRALGECIAQLPNDAWTTSAALAVALGEPRATGAVERTVRRWQRTGSKPGLPLERVLPLSTNREQERTGYERSSIWTGFVTDAPLRSIRDHLRSLASTPNTDQDRIHQHEHGSDQPLRWMIGLDVAYESDGERAWGGAAVYDLETREPVGGATVATTTRFPYISGYFSMREFPVLKQLLDRLGNEYDLGSAVLMIDGNGRLHPHRMGLATFTGLVLGLVTIGCAKRPIRGARIRHTNRARTAANDRTSNPNMPYATEVEYDGETLALACTPPPPATKPVIVSVGHRISLETAARLVHEYQQVRIPEPLRAAHHRSIMAKAAAHNQARDEMEMSADADTELDLDTDAHRGSDE